MVVIRTNLLCDHIILVYDNCYNYCWNVRTRQWHRLYANRNINNVIYNLRGNFNPAQIAGQKHGPHQFY